MEATASGWKLKCIACIARIDGEWDGGTSGGRVDGTSGGRVDGTSGGRVDGKTSCEKVESMTSSGRVHRPLMGGLILQCMGELRDGTLPQELKVSFPLELCPCCWPSSS